MSISRSDVMGLIAQLTGNGNVIVIPRLFIEICDGDYPASALLNQILYWSERSSGEGGWIAKTYEDWKKELGLSKYQVSRAAAALQKFGLETKVKRSKFYDGNCAVHYRLTRDVFVDELMRHVNDGKSRNFTFESQETSLSQSEETLLSYTKTTTETTPEIKEKDSTPAGVGLLIDEQLSDGAETENAITTIEASTGEPSPKDQPVVIETAADAPAKQPVKFPYHWLEEPEPRGPDGFYPCTHQQKVSLIDAWYRSVRKHPTGKSSKPQTLSDFIRHKGNLATAEQLWRRGIRPADFAECIGRYIWGYYEKDPSEVDRAQKLDQDHPFAYWAKIVEKWVEENFWERVGYVVNERYRITLWPGKPFRQPPGRPGVKRYELYLESDCLIDLPPLYIRPDGTCPADDEERFEDDDQDDSPSGITGTPQDALRHFLGEI